MRTTLDIDDDVLMATKELARYHAKSVGQIVSNHLRVALAQRADVLEPDGIPVFPIQPHAGVVTTVLINRPRNETW